MNDAKTEAALEAQQTLAESSLELVETTYRDALTEGMSSPIVLLVDCEDELGGQIARGWLGDEAIDDAIALEQDAEADEDGTTVFARAVAWDQAAAELRTAFPYLAPALEQAPAGDGVFIVSITAGGASALTAPLS